MLTSPSIGSTLSKFSSSKQEKTDQLKPSIPIGYVPDFLYRNILGLSSAVRIGDIASCRCLFRIKPSWLPKITCVGAMSASPLNHQIRQSISSGDIPCVLE